VSAGEVDIKHCTFAENDLSVGDGAAVQCTALVKVQATELSGENIEEPNTQLMGRVGDGLVSGAAGEGVVHSFRGAQARARFAHTQPGKHIELEQPERKTKGPLELV
jgi:hypothetical protein